METRFDYEPLRELIRRRKVRGGTLAKAMDVTPATLSTKLTHGLPFTQPHILAMCGVLGIPVSKIPVFFFRTKFRK